jgi:hypothetical protein
MQEHYEINLHQILRTLLSRTVKITELDIVYWNTSHKVYSIFPSSYQSRTASVKNVCGVRGVDHGAQVVVRQLSIMTLGSSKASIRVKAVILHVWAARRCSGKRQRDGRSHVVADSKVKVVGELRLGTSHHNLAHGAQITSPKTLSPHPSRCLILRPFCLPTFLHAGFRRREYKPQPPDILGFETSMPHTWSS